MGIQIVVTSNLFEPIPAGANQFGLRDATARSLSRQPEAALSHAIAPWSDTVFNGEQVPRLLQEFRFLAKDSDDVIRGDLEEAASFIEGEIDRVGHGRHCYIVFLGD